VDESATPPAALTVAAGFQHDPKFDVDGFYLPTAPVQAGNFKLTNVEMGSESDFAQWEAGEREGVFGPIFIDLEDVTSPVTTNELGQQVHQVTIRVRAERYRLFPGEVAFAASDPKAGQILFVGRYHQTALAAERKDWSGQKPVLTGSLQVGSSRFDPVAFTWFEGD
ncbi:MAG: hypothetical protein WCI21_01855, partial [Alphaproteobacteria bacterium]